MGGFKSINLRVALRLISSANAAESQLLIYYKQRVPKVDLEGIHNDLICIQALQHLMLGTGIPFN